MESSAQDVHEAMESVVDYQTHHRLREAQVCKNHPKKQSLPCWTDKTQFDANSRSNSIQ